MLPVTPGLGSGWVLTNLAGFWGVWGGLWSAIGLWVGAVEEGMEIGLGDRLLRRMCRW